MVSRPGSSGKKPRRPKELAIASGTTRDRSDSHARQTSNPTTASLIYRKRLVSWDGRLCGRTGVGVRSSKAAVGSDKQSVGETPNATCDDQLISVPVGSCPGVRNVFTNSPSPQTIISGNRLNHRPSGTSGSVSSHRDSKPSCEVEMSRSRTRLIRCAISG